MPWVGFFVFVFIAYLVAGTLFALVFFFRGLHRIDPASTDSSLGFKAIIMPGCIMLWPIMLLKWVRS